MPRLPAMHTPNLPHNVAVPTSHHRDGNNVRVRALTPKPLEVNRGHTAFHQEDSGPGLYGAGSAKRMMAPDYHYNRDDTAD